MRMRKGITRKMHRVGGRGVGRKGMTGHRTARQPKGFGYRKGR
jgi:hypothetical protein